MIYREILKKVIVEQREQFLEMANPIQRDALLGTDFGKISRLKEAVVITGVRRSGKSYLLKMIWRKIGADLNGAAAADVFIDFGFHEAVPAHVSVAAPMSVLPCGNCASAPTTC